MIWIQDVHGVDAQFVRDQSMGVETDARRESMYVVSIHHPVIHVLIGVV